MGRRLGGWQHLPKSEDLFQGLQVADCSWQEQGEPHVPSSCFGPRTVQRVSPPLPVPSLARRTLWGQPHSPGPASPSYTLAVAGLAPPVALQHYLGGTSSQVPFRKNCSAALRLSLREATITCKGIQRVERIPPPPWKNSNPSLKRQEVRGGLSVPTGGNPRLAPPLHSPYLGFSRRGVSRT